MTEPTTAIRRRLTVTGQVQGVGFRPFVYRLARELQLTGWVRNDTGGVTLEIQGTPDAAREFVARLHTQAPPMARIADTAVEDRPRSIGEKRFEIRPSAGGELTDAQITVDTAVCADCLREMHESRDPRYRYPFINCTNCGPRYTIVRKIPYDRPNTSMAEFGMCPMCAAQYGDVANRRFHAQPVACPDCGPDVWLVDRRGRQIAAENTIPTAARLLREGKTVALKGLGGFHLACRADDRDAVSRLRMRKERDAKPFALMVADLEQARKIVDLPEGSEAERLLTSPICPIVVLPRRFDAELSRSITYSLSTLGVMLPYTPLHHLLFDQGLGPLVMTSGNVSDEPLTKDNDQAISHLAPLADAILLHNRDIERRLDDSVVQIHWDGTPSVLRRARGYVPTPIHLPNLAAPRGTARKTDADDPTDENEPAVLGVGAELKSTVCLYRDGRAVLSEHIGDLKDGRTYRHFIDTIHHLEALFDVTPHLLAADLHPQYLSSEYAAKRHRGEIAGRDALPITHVQHHHAHAAACMAEHGRTEPVAAVICDGVGYGDDGAVWGCEILRASLTSYERLGHLRYVRMPGGDAAAVEAWRPAAAILSDAFGVDEARELLQAPFTPLRYSESVIRNLEMIERNAGCMPSSSLGRWFDAVGGLSAVGSQNNYEGQVPMQLEAAAEGCIGADAYPYRITEDRPFQIDFRPMVEALIDDLCGQAVSEQLAARFHETVAAALADAARKACKLRHLDTVVLSGGCFANRYLTARLTAYLQADGLTVLRHRTIPTNDGGISLGQAVIAASRARYHPPTRG